MITRLKVGVIFGGKSGEHEVSIQSAKSIIGALDPSKYEVDLLGISKSGKFIIGEEAMFGLNAGHIEDNLSVAPQTVRRLEDQSVINSSPEPFVPDTDELRGALEPLKNPERYDVVIPVLHGTFGEDGAVQGLLELLNVPYVGAGIASSAVALDKIMMKMQFYSAGLPQVKFKAYSRRDCEKTAEIIEYIGENLGYPCFVKPANSGSSVGISKVKSPDHLVTALNLALQYDRKIIVELGLDAREIEVGVLGNDDPEVSVLGEVIPANEFYDYKAKYINGESTLIIPADVGLEQEREIRNLAIRAFQAVDCSGLARVDFFIEKNTNRVFVNEINTMPGFTKHSMFPKLWEESGLSYSQLINRLIELALERHGDRQQIVTEYRPD